MRPLLTVGHSNRALDELIALARGHAVERIVDVRRFPGSRRNPQFGREALAAALVAAGIEYAWCPALGGRRSRPKGAAPSAWQVAGFAAYADYMQTAEFRRAIADLLATAERQSTAVMCAEAVPYRCHRRLIADWVVLHGGSVLHLLDARRREPHRVTAFARLDGDLVHYDAGAQLPLAGLPVD
jgi:uncharacterized protein (DUF488 family)